MSRSAKHLFGRTISRRTLLGSLGCAVGSAAAGSAAAFAQNGLVQPPGSSGRWTYHCLDPDSVADLAYGLYPEGSCMYAVFSSILLSLAEEFGEPYASFPRQMMRYGHGGVGGWGTICGALNGAAAAFGLFTATREESDRLTDGLLQWYQDTPLPKYVPVAKDTVEMPEAVPQSVLCHISTVRWREEANCAEMSAPLRKERCRRLSADTAKRATRLLNAYAEVRQLPCKPAITPPTGLSDDGSTKMKCWLCH